MTRPDLVVIPWAGRSIDVDVGDLNPTFNRCPVTKKLEHITVSFSYTPRCNLIEIGSFREWFDVEWGSTVEVIAQSVFEILHAALEPSRLKVTVKMIESTLTPWSVTVEK